MNFFSYPVSLMRHPIPHQVESKNVVAFFVSSGSDESVTFTRVRIIRQNYEDEEEKIYKRNPRTIRTPQQPRLPCTLIVIPVICPAVSRETSNPKGMR
jgi:hypothetical protein